jgi:hypothetical protein
VHVEADTAPKLMLRNAVRFADRPAYREKDLGIWQTWTWRQVEDEVRALALGLYILGLSRGDKIAIIGDNRPQLYWTFTAAQSLGAIPVPVYQDSVADEMAYVLAHAEVSFAVAENQEQVDKVLALADRVPTLRRVIYKDPRGLKKYDHSRLHALSDVQKLGREELEKNPRSDEWWRCEIAAGKGSERDPLHFGNHRPTQGGRAEPPQSARHLRERQPLRQADGEGRDHCVPAHGVGRRPHLLVWAGPLRRVLRLLSGKHGNHRRGSPRDRPYLLLRPAAPL